MISLKTVKSEIKPKKKKTRVEESERRPDENA
jgi:hypothetical protein